MIMPNVILDNPPRDVRIDRDDKIKYKSLKDRFDLDNDKAIFLIALNVGFFYDLKLKLKTHPEHMWQLSTFTEEDIRKMILITFYEKKDVDKIFDGKEVIRTSEEYANGGIKKLYKIFIEEGNQKDDTLIVEEIVDQISEKIKNYMEL